MHHTRIHINLDKQFIEQLGEVVLQFFLFHYYKCIHCVMIFSGLCCAPNLWEYISWYKSP